MVNSWPRNTKKETVEKTTERTIRTCTAWSHSEKRKTFPRLKTKSLFIWTYTKWICCLPVSLEDAHNQVPVKLSNLQLYHRSEFSMPSHTHQDFKERLDMTHTAGYLALAAVIQLKWTNLTSWTWLLPSPWLRWTALPVWWDAEGSQTWAGMPFSVPYQKQTEQIKFRPPEQLHPTLQGNGVWPILHVCLFHSENQCFGGGTFLFWFETWRGKSE